MVSSVPLTTGADMLTVAGSKLASLLGPGSADAPAALPVAAASSGRDLRIDFLRGLALLAIFVDHVPWNPLSKFTPQALGLSDAAEAFVFMSGLVCGIAYSKVLLSRGWGAVWGKVLKRCGQLYLANLLMLAACVGIAWVARERGPGGDEYAPFFTHTGAAVRDAVLLRFAPGLLQVLDLYMIMLLVLPVGLWLMHGRGGRKALLAVSLVVYVGAQCSLINMSESRGSWNFNPLAWQLLFFAGVSLRRPAGSGEAAAKSAARVVSEGRLAWAAVVALVMILMAMHVEPASASGRLRASLSVTSDQVFVMAGKSMLEPLRAAHFLLVAYACGVLIPRRGPFFESAIGRVLITTGRHSLPVFVLGGVLSYAGGFVVDRAGLATMAFVAVNVAGMAMLVMFARGLEARARALKAA